MDNLVKGCKLNGELYIKLLKYKNKNKDILEKDKRKEIKRKFNQSMSAEEIKEKLFPLIEIDAEDVKNNFLELALEGSEEVGNASPYEQRVEKTVTQKIQCLKEMARTSCLV